MTRVVLLVIEERPDFADAAWAHGPREEMCNADIVLAVGPGVEGAAVLKDRYGRTDGVVDVHRIGSRPRPRWRRRLRGRVERVLLERRAGR